MTKPTDRMPKKLSDLRILMNFPTEENAVEYAARYTPHLLKGNFKPKNLLAGVHKTRLRFGTDQQRAMSAKWLIDNGYRVDLNHIEGDVSQ
jgi:hypothetical protein